MPNAEIRFTTDQEYEILRTIRDRHGVTWRGMLLQGARQVQGYDLRKALLQLDPAEFEPTADHHASTSVTHRRSNSSIRTWPTVPDHRDRPNPNRRQTGPTESRQTPGSATRATSENNPAEQDCNDAIGLSEVRSLLPGRGTDELVRPEPSGGNGPDGEGVLDE